MADLSRAELRDAWEGADGYTPGKDRPQWVREHADALDEHTNTSEPVPRGSNHAIRAWLDSYKGVVTTQLRADDAETPTDGDTEGADNA